MSRIMRGMLSVGVVGLAGLVFVPAGCGPSQEGLVLSALGQPPGTRTIPEAPEELQRRLEQCVKDNHVPLPPAEGDAYAVDLRVQVTPSGLAQAAEVSESMISGHPLEACFARVLTQARFPMRTLAMHREDGAHAGGAPPPSRELIGQWTAVLPTPVSLMPVVITAAAVVVVVGIVLYVTSETVPRATADAPPLVTSLPVASAVPTSTAVPMVTAVPKIPTAEVEARCHALLLECLENRKQPQWNRKRYGKYKECGSCERECRLHTDGIWPEKKCPRSR